MPRTRVRTALALSATYFANFGSLAASAPFLALLLADAGFSDSATAEILAGLLLVRWVAIPGWTWLADRSRSIRRVLQLASVAALLAFAPLAVRLPTALVVAALVAFSLCRAPFGPLLDSLTLAEEADGGAAFGRLRAWGTAGYVLGALVTGACVARAGSPGVSRAAIPFLACAAAFSFLVPARAAPPRAHTVARGGIRNRRRIAALFVVALLHQVGLAPYDALFPARLTALAGATTAGVALAVGAGAEFVLMLAGASLPRRWGAARVMKLACLGSAARWAIVGFSSVPAILVAVQALHALTFGAFYLASVAIVNEEFSAQRRTFGQGLFSAWAFGVAASAALAFAGLVERTAGIAMVFRIGAVASVLAAMVPLEGRDEVGRA